MMQIEKPKITVEENADGSFAKVVIEPLERGFGTTLGNSFRRILYASLPGIAPVAIRIAGIAHEFSNIVGVKEDVSDIILNLKSIALATTNTDLDFKTTLRLNKNFFWKDDFSCLIQLSPLPWPAEMKLKLSFIQRWLPTPLITLSS